MSNGELVFDLFDNSDTTGDSHALIDNVTLGSDVANFDAGTDLDGFVDAFPNGYIYVDNQQMRINEDPSGTPTEAYKNYYGFTATTLSFDMDLFLSPTVGTYGQDNFVVTLFDLDDTSYQPFEVLSVTASGTEAADIVNIESQTVPVPGAAGLCVLGLALARWKRRRG